MIHFWMGIMLTVAAFAAPAATWQSLGRLPIVTSGAACTAGQLGQMGVTSAGVAQFCNGATWAAFTAGGGGGGSSVMTLGTIGGSCSTTGAPGYTAAGTSLVCNGSTWIAYGNKRPGGDWDSCWIFPNANYAGYYVIGYGKVVSNQFTGIMAYSPRGQLMPQNNLTGYGAASILSAVINGSITNTNNNYYWSCGTDASCAWSYAGYYGSYYYVVGVSSLPISGQINCTP